MDSTEYACKGLRLAPKHSRHILAINMITQHKAINRKQ